MSKCIALVGNPNVGKTSLFNSLTHASEHVGNWHGVTVDLKSKDIKLNDERLTVIDLPGLYSLSAYSLEEEIPIKFLREQVCVIYNICDANNLQRNLYLTLQLLEEGKSPILLINFADEAEKKGRFFDAAKLSKILNVPVYKINANNKKQIKKVVISSLVGQMQKYESKLLPYIEKLNKTDNIALQAKLRYEYIETILKQCQTPDNFVYGKYKIDKIILNKFLAIPIFLCILSVIFFVTFSSVGVWASQGLKIIIDNYIGTPINSFLISKNAPVWVTDLIASGIIAGAGGLISFLPQIVLLFLFLTVLEDSGYLSRLAFVCEDIFRRVGLTGKSVFTLLMGFGCATTAVITARNLEDKNSKIKTAMITPYMSCSAKLPLYVILGGAFFGANILIIILLYLLGVIVALTLSVILERGKLKSGEQSFMLEFAPYRMPSLKRVILAILENCKLFVLKVGTLLASLNIIVWVLQSFSFSFVYVVGSTGSSMLKTMGQIVAPLLAPIGLNNWGIAACLITGIFAKEMVISSMAIINNVPTASNFNAMLSATIISASSVIHFDTLTAVVCMIFVLLYCPCLSTIGVLKKEIGAKYTALAVALQFGIAYCLCIFVFNIGLIFKVFGVFNALLSILALATIVASAICIARAMKKKRMCSNCNKCKKCL